MSGTRCRRGGLWAADIKQYMDLISLENTNSEEVDEVRRKLAMAINHEVTKAQREYMLLYYKSNMNMTQIAQMMGVDKSTVSRTIQRGEQKLLRCVRFCSEDLLLKAGINFRHSKNMVKRKANLGGIDHADDY